MKSINYEHAAQRKTLVGHVYSKGSQRIKEEILDELDGEFASLHEKGYVHIHAIPSIINLAFNPVKSHNIALSLERFRWITIHRCPEAQIFNLQTERVRIDCPALHILPDHPITNHPI